MDAHLQSLILERLAADKDISEAAADLVLAACEGPESLEFAATGQEVERGPLDAQPTLPARAPGAYLESMSVRGFRGIGEEATIGFAPGPGLTLVVGRNGSGKSSFTEGLELLMTGENRRWESRSKVWKDGWRNIHDGDEPRLVATFHVEGEEGLTRVERAWGPGDGLEAGSAMVSDGSGRAMDLEAHPWSGALERFRPFLSYSELGSMFDEPKTMYDALGAILGLGDLETLYEDLRKLRLRVSNALDQTRKETREMVALLRGTPDPRAEALAALLDRRDPDIEGAERALAGSWEGADPEAQLVELRALAGLVPPSEEAIEACHDEAAEAERDFEHRSDGEAADAARLADLLDAALAHAATHDGADCPVCGSQDVLDDAWRVATEAEVSRLRRLAAEYEQARERLTRARRALTDLAPSMLPIRGDDEETLGVETTALRAAWDRWTDARDRAVDEVAMALVALARAMSDVSGRATAELERRESAWRPLAVRIARWLPEAGPALAGATRLPAIEEAERWARDTAEAVQAERLRPIAEQAKANWEMLRHESNVVFDDLTLRRRGTQRSAMVDVRVDGSAETSAFGVMSQGELHALAISVFLPRATLSESPFRFVVIDDPVQSMDPAKVDGLARVLELAASDRQVVVFTHDDRLPEAVRALGISARVIEVTRRPGSIVQTRVTSGPVERYLSDARALLKEPRLPADAAGSVVPALCRHALEAAAADAFRRRRLLRGDRHRDIEDELARARTLYQKLALALFDDAGASGDVARRVTNRWGERAVRALKTCNRGAHQGIDGDLRELVDQTAALAPSIARVS